MFPYQRKRAPAALPRHAPPDAPNTPNKSGTGKRATAHARRYLVVLGYLWLVRTLYSQGMRLGATVSERLQAPPPPSHRRKPQPTLAAMRRDRGCAALFASERPLYADADWRRLRDAWRRLGGTPVAYAAGDPRISAAPAGFAAPVAAGQTADGKGRGLFAARDLGAGEMTAGGMDAYAYFRTGREYRDFLGALGDGEACDAMAWTWPETDIGRRGRTLLVMELGVNSLLNDGGSEGANCGCPEDRHCGKYDEYALRNISKGEELLLDYGRFYPSYPGELWSSFGL